MASGTNKIPYGSASYRKLNPHLFPAVDKVETRKPEQVGRGEKEDKKLEGSQRCRGFRIQLVCFRRRLLDEHDNLRAACKPAVDRITERLGFFADNDSRLVWEYGQVKTEGEEGIAVRIELL